jgi:NhaP-type Na+/H+ or K+/H+ antiporter
MINVNLLFIFLAGTAFLGFIVNAMFDRIRVTKVLPLILLGLLVGPVLSIVNTGPTSTIALLTPFMTAVAVSFILFDVGLNINIFKLGRVITKATAFTSFLAIVTAIVASLIAVIFLHWTLLESLIFGFAISGPSSVIVPTLMRFTKINEDLKTILIYESVTSDVFQLVLPLLLFEILVHTSITLESVTSLILGVVVGSVTLGFVSALAWLYLLNRFKEYSRAYTWMLTISMVVATYGIAQELDFSGALTVFTFGIVFANLGAVILRIENLAKTPGIGEIREGVNRIMKKYFYFNRIRYVRGYQKEIEFFTSTFFFVYVGMLVSISEVSLLLVGVGVIIVLSMMVIRVSGLRFLKEYIQGDEKESRITRRIVSSNISRGLSPAIVATLPIAFGIVIPNFIDQIFLVILFSNVASTIGIALAYRE